MNEYTELVKNIQSNYDSFLYCITNNVQEFVNKMQNSWASPQAVEYFNNSFLGYIDKIVSSFNVMFACVNASINSIGYELSAKNHVEFKPIGVEQAYYPNQIINVSNIADNINNSSGINVDESSKNLGDIKVIYDKCEKSLNELKEYIKNSGFISGINLDLINSLIDGFRSKFAQNVSNLLNETKAAMHDTISNNGSQLQTGSTAAPINTLEEPTYTEENSTRVA